MDGGARDSEAILAAARASLAEQRAGGRRIAPVPPRRRGGRIGPWLVLTLLIVSALLAGLGVGGLTVGAALLGGLVLTALIVAGVVWRARRTLPALPPREGLAEGDLGRVLNQAATWLDARRRVLPASARGDGARIVAALDELSARAGEVDPAGDAARDLRRLAGEHLPDIVCAWEAVPASLRGEGPVGDSPDAQLARGLARIAGELDEAGRRLAEGALDRLAIESRFLDSRYGSAEGAEPGAFPPPSPDRSGQA